ncbi:MAG: GNAT family N-acetyltransferase [Alphaproteobacteria bacterium]|nr:GNAT family N-acetyltransferase [Alphaproteobacteria bacterium]
MSGFDIHEIGDSWAERYGALCAATPSHLIYATWSFRSFLRDTLGCRPSYLGAIDQAGNLVAALPLMSQEGRFGRVVNSLPFFGSNGGLIGADPAARATLWSAYVGIARAPGTAAATVIFAPGESVDLPVAPDFADRRIGQITDLGLARSSEALFAAIDGSSRRNVRKAESSGVEVVIDNDAFPALQDIHRENMAAIGGREKPTRFFELLPRHFRAGVEYNIYVARLGGEIVAALLLFYAGRTVDYYIPATRLSARAAQPSAAILFRAMRDAADAGYTAWNWGGTWVTQDGVLRFKRKWAAHDVPYDYHVLLNNRELLTQTPKTLLNEYPFFYVLPFDALSAKF